MSFHSEVSVVFNKKNIGISGLLCAMFLHIQSMHIDNKDLFDLMHDPKMVKEATDTMKNVVSDMKKNYEYQKEYRERQYQSKLDSLKNELKHASPTLAPVIQQEIAILMREKERSETGVDKWDDVGREVIGGVAKVYTGALQAIVDDHRHEKELEKVVAQEAIRAEANKATAIAKFTMLIDTFKNPKNIGLGAGAITLTALGVCSSYYGSEFVFNELKNWMHVPSLAKETSILSLRERFMNWVLGKKSSPAKVSDVILEKSLEERIALLARSVSNTVYNGALFRNILFYGPPGTGKTMLAQRIARSCGMDYIYFAASDFNQFNLRDALQKINELFSYARKSPKKLMIIIDECEVLFANRSKDLSEDTRKVLTEFLTHTGTESHDFLIVGLTNRPQDFDEASLSRFDERIKINPPQAAERERIFKKYARYFLFDQESYQPRPLTFWKKVMGKKQARTRPIKVEENALDENMCAWIFSKITGFVGRDIMKLVLALQATADATTNRTLTADMVTMIVEQKVAEHALGQQSL